MNCSLCDSAKTAIVFSNKTREFHHCEQCDLIFVPQQFHVVPAQEKARYDTHQNDLHIPGYREFLQKLLTPLSQYLKPGMQGLDFGSGPVPALQMLLIELGFSVSIYDPYYTNNLEVLKQQYDFVTCTEVVEHFCHPAQTWQILVQLIKTAGYLGIMTQLHDTTIDFAQWWYKNDYTHVAFYSQKTMQWLANKFGFSVIYNIDNVVLLRNVS